MRMVMVHGDCFVRLENGIHIKERTPDSTVPVSPTRPTVANYSSGEISPIPRCTASHAHHMLGVSMVLHVFTKL